MHICVRDACSINITPERTIKLKSYRYFAYSAVIAASMLLSTFSGGVSCSAAYTTSENGGVSDNNGISDNNPSPEQDEQRRYIYLSTDNYDDDDDDDDDDSSSSSSSSTDDSSTTNSDSNYSSASSSSDYIVPGATWFTPTAVHGEGVIVVLPLVNMLKGNVSDVVVTPVISANTDEFPFEIFSTGFTQKIDTLYGETSEKDRNKRAQNCVWAFQTREDVKSGYYKINYNVLYTNPEGNQESCTVSTYVKTIGLAKFGNTSGYEDPSDKSTPRIIVTGFTTSPAEVYAGDSFTLNLNIKNTSKRTAVNNLELDLTAVVAGKDESSSYAAFLPSSGSNSFYLDSLPAGGEKVLSMDFTAKADLEQKPYVMSIKMNYENDSAAAFEGSAEVSIPIKQVSKFDTSAITAEPAAIAIGEQTNLMFNIYNTGKTKLYNVSVSVSADSIEPTFGFVGGLESGATGSVDMMISGISETMDDGTIDAVISYEDENGNVTSTVKKFNLTVTADSFNYDDMDFSEDDFSENDGNSLILPITIAVCTGLAIIITIIVVVRKRIAKKKELENEEDEDI